MCCFEVDDLYQFSSCDERGLNTPRVAGQWPGMRCAVAMCGCGGQDNDISHDLGHSVLV